MRINKPKWAILHHEGAWNGVEDVDSWHEFKWNFKSSLGFYLGYHYYIDQIGKITQCRADTDEGIHCKGMNLKSLGICMEGNFTAINPDGSDVFPTNEQKQALKWLLIRLVRQYNIPLAKIVPHRYFKATECYGLNLKDDWGQRLAYQEIQKYPENEIERKLLRTAISLTERILKLTIKLYAKLFG